MNWDAIKYIFRIPLSWFRRVDRRSNIISASAALDVNRNHVDGTLVSINPKGLVQELSETGTPVDESIDATEALDTAGSSFSWTPGGDNGLIIDLFCNYETAGSYKTVSRCRVTISNSGLITSVQGLPERYRVR